MQFRPVRKKGFIFNEDVAEDLGILNEYKIWEEDYDYTPLVEVFNEKFKGFEFNVGEKKYRFNVKNSDEVKQQQSSIDNFVSKFFLSGYFDKYSLTIE